jgi:glycosyltransferase involved in cell wall biosynthesis
MKPLVSVIIPVKGYLPILERCLGSIRSSGYSRLEIIVIAKDYSDELKKTVKDHGARLLQAHVGRSVAKNMGLERSRGKYVLFMDHDHEINPGTIESCVSKCIKGYSAVKIPEKFVGDRFWGRCSAKWKNSMVQAWGEVGGIPRFYCKYMLSIWFKEGSIWWEDQEHYDILRRMGIKTAWAEGKLIHHEPGDIWAMISSYNIYGRSASKIKQNKALFLDKALLTLRTFKALLNSKPRSILLIIGTLTITLLKGVSFILGALRAR